MDVVGALWSYRRFPIEGKFYKRAHFREALVFVKDSTRIC